MTYTADDVQSMTTAQMREHMKANGIPRKGAESKAELQAKLVAALPQASQESALTPPPDVATATCPKCRLSGPIETVFGYRCTSKATDAKPARIVPQSWCRACRSEDGATRAKAKAQAKRAAIAQDIIKAHGLDH